MQFLIFYSRPAQTEPAAATVHSPAPAVPGAANPPSLCLSSAPFQLPGRFHWLQNLQHTFLCISFQWDQTIPSSSVLLERGVCLSLTLLWQSWLMKPCLLCKILFSSDIHIISSLCPFLHSVMAILETWVLHFIQDYRLEALLSPGLCFISLLLHPNQLAWSHSGPCPY